MLGFLGDAHAIDGPEAFTTELLDRLAGLMQSEFATFYRRDAAHEVAYAYVPCSYELRYPPVPLGDWSDDAVKAFGPGRGDVVRSWSDVVPLGLRRRFELTSWAGAFEVVDCAWSAFGLGSHEEGMLVLHRQERDFSERDREKLRTLRPHIAGLIRSARARRLAGDLLAAVDVLDEHDPRRLLLLGESLELEHATASAQRILERWFGPLDGRLPAPIDDWLRAGRSAAALGLERGRQPLLFQALSDSAVHLTEEKVLSATLTPRELDVLGHLESGKSTAQIARALWVAEATVSKHLEHIYRKLGVSSRTAALAAVSARRATTEHG